MFDAVGYGRQIALAGAALALGTAAAAAHPAEPLTVTPIGETEAQLLVSADSAGEIRNPDNRVDEFSRAVSGAVQLQQQSIQASCRSAPRGSGPISAQWAWEARCRYQRY